MANKVTKENKRDKRMTSDRRGGMSEVKCGLSELSLMKCFKGWVSSTSKVPDIECEGMGKEEDRRPRKGQCNDRARGRREEQKRFSRGSVRVIDCAERVLGLARRTSAAKATHSF
jgi:hypothetical protein